MDGGSVTSAAPIGDAYPGRSGAGYVPPKRVNRLAFEVDERTNHIVVRVNDLRSGDVVRTIPPEAALRAAAAIGRVGEAPGLLLDEER